MATKKKTEAQAEAVLMPEALAEAPAEELPKETEVADVLVEARPAGHTASRKKRAETPAEDLVETPADEEPEASEPMPALTSASRRSFKERQEQEAAFAAARNLRQEDAVRVGGYLTAQRRNTTLEGRIAGVVEQKGHVFWVIYDGPVTVYIPFHEALPSMAMDDLMGTDGIIRQKQMLAKSIGATIPFSVEEIFPDGDDFLVYGSRKVAMQRIANRYFGPRATNPVKVGDTLTGQFLAVGPHVAWVTVNGMDVRLTKQQLSHRHMERLPSYYYAGDFVKLRVQELKEEDGKIAMKLSARPCELEECMTRQARINKGNRFVATLTSHRVLSGKNAKGQKIPYYVASMWLEDVNMPAYATLATQREQEVAHSGDKVMVEVDKVMPNGYIRCIIIKFLSH